MIDEAILTRNAARSVGIVYARRNLATGSRETAYFGAVLGAEFGGVLKRGLDSVTRLEGDFLVSRVFFYGKRIQTNRSGEHSWMFVVLSGASTSCRPLASSMQLKWQPDFMSHIMLLRGLKVVEADMR